MNTILAYAILGLAFEIGAAWLFIRLFRYAGDKQ
jgi:hypothetical protein